MVQGNAGLVADAKLCFVVMGFGKKTDYETGRTLDLNATYKEIRACAEFCVNGHWAGNCHLVWRHNELEETRRT